MARAFASWIDRHPDDGRYVLNNGFDWTYVEVEDVPFFIRSVRIGDGCATVELSDGTEEPLAATALRVGHRGALYTKVKRGRFDARFNPGAQTALAPLLDEGPAGVEIVVSGHRYLIAAICDNGSE
jgi:hypothetical protein